MQSFALRPWHLLCLLVCLTGMADVSAQPNLSQRSDPAVISQGSAHYTFERLSAVSQDGLRRYRVVLALPKKAALAGGHSVIYLLDGNAALDALDERLLATLDAADPPVIVAIAHDTDLRFDPVARAYDYTPPVAGNDAPVDERGRAGGGAASFLDLIVGTIKPAVARHAQIDMRRQTLWGHSYGGLFVLYALLHSPDAFQLYVAASPSIWWQYGAILKDEADGRSRILALAPQRRPQLTILLGSEEGRRRAQASPPTGMRASVAPDAAQQFAHRMAADRLEVDFQIIEGLDHGPMLPASLLHALRLAADLPPHP